MSFKDLTLTLSILLIAILSVLGCTCLCELWTHPHAHSAFDSWVQILLFLCYVGLLPLIGSNLLGAPTPLPGKAPAICSRSLFAIPYCTLLEYLQEHSTQVLCCVAFPVADHRIPSRTQSRIWYTKIRLLQFQPSTQGGDCLRKICLASLVNVLTF